MKFDKELLLKHRFWIGIAIAYPLAIVGIALLMTSVSGQINKDRTAIQDHLNKVKKDPGAVANQKGIEVYREFTAKADGKRDIVWGDAYDVQAYLFTWPDAVEKQYEFKDGYHANDVQVLKDLKDVKDAPADSSSVVHGVLRKMSPEGFVIDARDGKTINVHRTPSTKVDGGAVLFSDLRQQVGKVLAVNHQRGKYFNDKLTPDEQRIYGQAYKDQVLPIIDSVNPLGFDERNNIKGVVQLRGWTYDSSGLGLEGKPFIRFLENDWNTRVEISEEAWMAQEDLWLQREIYRLVRATNDMVSKLKKEDQGQAAKAGTARFGNPYFTLDMKLVGDELHVQITNRLKRRQRLDQDFMVRFQDKGAGLPEKIRIAQQPLDPAGTVDQATGTRLDTKLVITPLDKGPTRTGIYDVEQVLTWESAAIRRIDQVVFAQPEAHSHRTFPTPLKAYAGDAGAGGVGVGVGAPPGPGGPPPGTGFGGPPPGLGGRPGGPPGPGIPLRPGGPKGAFGAAAGPRGALPNGFWAERYLNVTPQARQIPVAVSLIVDQDHVDRVLTTFNNSPLRFRTTQVLVNHYPGSVRPVPSSAFGALPGLQPFGGLTPGADAAQDMEANMEMVIYGIVTMYERFPPRPAAAAPAAPAIPTGRPEEKKTP